jgi:hypothetical protein
MAGGVSEPGPIGAGNQKVERDCARTARRRLLWAGRISSAPYLNTKSDVRQRVRPIVIGSCGVVKRVSRFERETRSLCPDRLRFAVHYSGCLSDVDGVVEARGHVHKPIRRAVRLRVSQEVSEAVFLLD